MTRTWDLIKARAAENGLLVALVALVAVFAAINPRFISLGNVEAILLQIAEIGLVALPVAFVVMMGCADLSVGSIASCSAVTAALVMTSTGSKILGILAGLAFGVFAGAVNGILVAYFHLNTLVVALAFLSVWGGLALLLTQGKTVAGLPKDFTVFGTFRVGFVPIQILLLVVGIAVAWWLLNHTAKGREVLAVGGSSRAAHLMGVGVRSTRFQVFVVTGALSAVSGMMLAAKLAAASPTIAAGTELTVLTVVLLGGVAFEGGVGRIGGVVVGLLFIGVLRNGLVIFGVSPYIQTILVGLVLVFAVAMDRSVQRLVRTLRTR